MLFLKEAKLVSSSSPRHAYRRDSNEKGGTGLNHFIFWPPFLLLLSAIVLNFWSPDQVKDGELMPGKFSTAVTIANSWVLNQFGWLFSVFAFLSDMICIAICCKIGI